jgi:hypothetical protein
MHLGTLQKWASHEQEYDAISAASMLGIAWEFTRRRGATSLDIDALLRALRIARSDSNNIISARFNSLPESWADRYSFEKMLDAWQLVEESTRPFPIRIELIQPLTAESLSIGAWLAQQHYCHLGVDRPRVPISWCWPLRMGFGDDERSTAMRQVFEDNLTQVNPWATQLARTVALSATDPACDVLFIPFDKALPAWLGPGRRAVVETDACVLLTPPSVDFEALATAIMRRRLRGSTLGVKATSRSPLLSPGLPQTSWPKSRTVDPTTLHFTKPPKA